MSPSKRPRTSKPAPVDFEALVGPVVPLHLPPVDDEENLAFLKAIDAFKRRTGRSFPTWSEVLQIVHAVGYRKVAPPSGDL